MFARFFIDRPIFAAVLSILITLGGAVGLQRLPVALYPEITPPTIEVSTSYPGAHSKTIADTVAAPIEQQVNGVEEMLYMSSTSTNDGNYTLTVTFRPGADLNISQVLVQSRVNTAFKNLPAEVQRRGVTVKKKSANVLMIVNLSSRDPSRKELYLSNYATIQLRDELARIEGVGDIVFLGQRDYAMRIWIDPIKLASRGLTPEDVTHAIEQQNAQVAAGQIGQPPVPTGQAFQFTINTLGRLSEPDQFNEIVLKTDEVGRAIRMKDVTEKIELGAATYDQLCTLDGQRSVALSVYPLPGANALATAKAVKDKMKELKTRFPEGVEYEIVYDTTPFVQESIDEVFTTLLIAVGLVAAVMLLFLQSWRSALIPLAAVPVAIIGTFGVMALMGFSLNTLTLFGLVLAVGIVVDDAIVVVEAAEYHLSRGLNSKDATAQAMTDVAGPVIAVGLVLAAVFIPCVFITGIVGQFFRQFAVTIAISTLISTFNSLTLTPALCALLLEKEEHGGRRKSPLPRSVYALLLGYAGYRAVQHFLPEWSLSIFGWWDQRLTNLHLTFETARAVGTAVTVALPFAILGYFVAPPLNWGLSWIFYAFNLVFELLTRGYLRVVRALLMLSIGVLLIYGGLLAGTWHIMTTTPSGFIPQQDKGYLIVNLKMTDASSLTETQKSVTILEAMARQIPGVSHTVAVSGQSVLLGGSSSNVATIYVMLDAFENRLPFGGTADEIAEILRRNWQTDARDATITVLGAPPVDGLGAAGGFRIMIEDRAANDTHGFALQRVGDRTVEEGNAATELQGLFSGFQADSPWVELTLDREKAESSGVRIRDIQEAMEKFFGSGYVNDFNRFGRTWQVIVQADAKFRDKLKALGQVQVKNAKSEMVPLKVFLGDRSAVGPVMVVRYNLHPVNPVTGNAKPGVSSGEAIAKMEAVTNQNLDPGMKAEWTELAFLQLASGDTALWAFVLSVVLVFLVLAAQYESWALPLAVILVVPMCLLCAAIGVRIAGQDINVFTQIGFVVLVGLACKNAILIVEFARNRHMAGASRKQATLDACQLRLRPIIMTSVAFILGVVPLVFARGAGAEMRQTLGTAVFAGMIGVTAFGVFLTPVFFFVIQWASDKVRGQAAETVD